MSAKDENFGRIGDVDLATVPPLADCRPGIEPAEYNILVCPTVQPEKAGSVFIPDNVRDQWGLAKQVGRIVAVAPMAFNYDNLPEGARNPQVGDIIWFARYAGGLVTGADGREYRIMKDKDVVAVLVRAEADGVMAALLVSKEKMSGLIAA